MALRRAQTVFSVSGGQQELTEPYENKDFLKTKQPKIEPQHPKSLLSDQHLVEGLIPNHSFS